MGTVAEPVDKPLLESTEPAETTVKVVSDAEGDAPSTEVGTRRFEGKVTPEQELSATVARKRRNISKKRSASVGRPRDQTPVRELAAAEAADEEQVSEPPPKTPERRKSKSSRKSSVEETPDTQVDVAKETKTNTSPRQTNSSAEETKVNKPVTEVEKQIEVTDETKRTVKTPSKDDVSALLIRAKQTAASKEKSVTRLRKDVRKVAVKRSKSAPREKVENTGDKELIESFKKAQLISAAIQLDKPIELERSASDASSSSNEKKPQRPTSIPLFSNILRRRKLEEERLTSEDFTQEQNEKESKSKAPVKQRITFKEIRQNWKEFKFVHEHEYDKIKSMRNRCLNDIVLLMIFCGFGGLMFKFTEGAFENFYKCGVKRVKRDFIDTLWRGSHHLREDDWKSLARTKLRDFEEQLHTAHEAGVTSYSGQRSWSFLNGIVYALTIVTTIGYGHMYPTTTTGMALTIVYAIIGIPLFLIVLTDFGKLFTRAIKFLWAFVRRLYYTGKCKQARKVTAVQEVMKGAQMMYEIATFRRPSQFNLDEENSAQNGPPQFPVAQPFPVAAVTPHSRDGDTEPPDTPAPSTYEIDDEFNLPISVALFLLIMYIFLGAVVYYVWEQWDFFASFYFVFISMSTIGFGDYVPRHPICMIVSIIYLVFGLALMSMCINVVQVKLSDTFRQASAKLGATIGLRVAEEDGSITTVPPPPVEVADVHASTKSI